MHVQVTAEAINALSALMLTVSHASDASGTSATLGCIQKHGQKLHDALQHARYHQIKQCRAAATEASTVLQTLLPAEALRAPKQAPTNTAVQQVEGQRRKGPWLHEKVAEGSGGAEEEAVETRAATQSTHAPSATPQSRKKAPATPVRHAYCTLRMIWLHATCR